MSKLAGVFYFDCRPPSPADEARVRACLQDPRGVAPAVYRRPGVVMGHSDPLADNGWDNRAATSPEGIVCSWDGRLDNSPDLPALEDGGEDPAVSAFALDAYRRRGTAGLVDLIGDWSLAIWDPRSRSVVLASDYAGIRPLYYYHGSDRMMWSSCLTDLVRWTGINELDEEYIAGFLTQGCVPHRTPYRGMFPVPAAHAVTFRGKTVSKDAFWELPVDRETRLENDESYEIRLRELFEESISARVKGHPTACAELSGGLDSSSVVCVASQIKPKPNLVTFSYTHASTSENRYFETVERASQSTGVHLQMEAHPFVARGHVGSSCPSWWEPRFQEMSRRMSKLGATVLLTGQMGDFIMGNAIDDSDQVADHLHNYAFLDAAREAFSWSQSLHVPIYSVLWRALRTNCSSWVAPTVVSTVCERYSKIDSLDATFRKRVALSKFDGHREFRWDAAPPGRRRRFRGLSEMLAGRLLQAPEDLQHVSYAHPFAHRPLVEFMLTIPASIVCRPGEPRRLMRRAFSSFLPPLILRRKSKGLYDMAYREALTPLAAELLRRPQDLRLVEFGFVDSRSFIERLTLFSGGVDCNEPQLRQLVLLEHWLRRGGPCGTAHVEDAALSWIN